MSAFYAAVGGLVILAIIAVVVSQRAQTPAVLQSAGSALAGVINAAVSPVAGAQGNGFGSVSSTVGGVTT